MPLALWLIYGVLFLSLMLALALELRSAPGTVRARRWPWPDIGKVAAIVAWAVFWWIVSVST